MMHATCERGKVIRNWVVVVAQLVERSLPKPDIHGSNRFICKFYYITTVLQNFIEKAKIQKKAAIGPFHCQSLCLLKMITFEIFTLNDFKMGNSWPFLIFSYLSTKYFVTFTNFINRSTKNCIIPFEKAHFR